jgi:hypothetical protein
VSALCRAAEWRCRTSAPRARAPSPPPLPLPLAAVDRAPLWCGVVCCAVRCAHAGVTFAPTTSPPTATPSSKPTAEPSTAAPTSARTILPPAQIFPDLSSFRLQLPLLSSSGRYTTITDLTNYTSSYFYADDFTGAMSFWCPSDGSVVNGSTFPRTTIRSTPFNMTTVPQSSSVQVCVCHGQRRSLCARVCRCRWPCCSIRRART